jgi:hypothetical protein
MTTDDPITESDVEHLRHMLGMREGTRRAYWGTRNHFAAGGRDIDSMERLRANGLVVIFRHPDLLCPQPIYRATRAGAERAGLHPAGIKRAGL